MSEQTTKGKRMRNERAKERLNTWCHNITTFEKDYATSLKTSSLWRGKQFIRFLNKSEKWVHFHPVCDSQWKHLRKKHVSWHNCLANCSILLLLLFSSQFSIVWVYWLEENTVTTVTRDEIIEPHIVEQGVSCTVRRKGTTYKGQIVAGMGKLHLHEYFRMWSIKFNIMVHYILHQAIV